MSEWMDIKQLSAYLNIKTATLFAMKRKGDLPYYKVNRLLRFKKDEIDEWMNSKKVDGEKHVEKVRKVLKGKVNADSMVSAVIKRAIESTKKG